MKKFLALLLAAFMTPSLAFAAVTEGRDYEVLAKPISQMKDAQHIEVLEFFAYFCIHCYHFEEPLLNAAKRFASDTYLRTEHIVWDDRHLHLARMAAAVNDTGLKFKADPAIFHAIFEEQKNLQDPAVFKAWAKEQTSFDGKKLLAAYESDKAFVEAKNMQALTQKYQINSTPTLIVGGKYSVNIYSAEQALETIQFLVNKVRQERGLPLPKATPVAKSQGALLAAQAR